MKIAISGKGGVGKTTIAAILSRTLYQKGFKVLAIDADSNSNLALALGISPADAEKLVPLSDNTSLVEEKTGARPNSAGVIFKLSFRVDDIIERFAVVTPCGVSLVVMGAVKSSGQGCMCPANAMIRAILRYLLIKRDEAVIVDLEAGVEHFGRGTAETVDVMLIVTEASIKSLETVKRIYKLSKELGIKKIFVVGNRIVDSSDEEVVETFCKTNHFPLLGFVPYDEKIRKSDSKGILLDARTASKGILCIQQLSEDLLRLVKI